jgi:hypothetical protein
VKITEALSKDQSSERVFVFLPRGMPYREMDPCLNWCEGDQKTEPHGFVRFCGSLFCGLEAVLQADGAVEDGVFGSGVLVGAEVAQTHELEKYRLYGRGIK